MEIQEIYSKFISSNGVSIDTRNIQKDCMFVALKGENFDANTFAVEALEKGAKYVIIDNSDYYINENTILVENSLSTLQMLANYHRKTLKTKLIALTGSNGKTTTKELINAVLSQQFEAIATIGNLNNHIGVPLTLLRLNEKTEIGIIEMGANHQKEIEFLCSIAEPDFGYITNFGKAHLEGFGGVQGVIKGKSELYEYLENNKKLSFVNLDDEIQLEKTKALPRFTFSNQTTKCDLFISKIEANPMVKVEYDNVEINSNLIGLYNATNLCAAIAIGKYFNIKNELIKKALEDYVPSNNRSQIIHKSKNEIILDAYNANPSSMSEALKNFIQLNEANKIAILGDMFELGNESSFEHGNIVSFMQNQKNVQSIFIGKSFFEHQIQAQNMNFFKDFESFKLYFENNLPNENLILIKGSRGMSLEKTLDLFD